MEGETGKSVSPAGPGKVKQAPPPNSFNSKFVGRASQLEQILQKKFGPLQTTTYGSHGYAASKPGYTPAHAIDVMVSKLGVAAQGEQKKLGDEIAAFCVKNFRAFGLGNIIWYERFYGGSGWTYYDWRPYYDAGYGSRDPEVHKHVDHVHIQCLNTGAIGEYEDV